MVNELEPASKAAPPDELAYQSMVSPMPGVAEIMTVPDPQREAFTAAGAPLIFDWTVTVCEAVAVLPDASVAVQMTVVVPAGKLAGALFVTPETEQLSEVTGVPRLTPVAEQLAALAVTVTAEGAVITGTWLSRIVTV